MKLKKENLYTNVSICLSMLIIFFEILYEVFKPPIGISRSLWLLVFSISSFFAFLGKWKGKNFLSTLVFYGNIFVLTVSLFLFKVIIAVLRLFL